MIHNVYVFSESGEPLMTVKLGSIEANSALLTGFLSAMESFSKKISQGDIEEINIKDYKFHIRACGSVYVALVADKTDRDVQWRLREACKVIEKRQGSFNDKLIEMQVRDVVTKKIGLRDRATSWANVGL